MTVQAFCLVFLVAFLVFCFGCSPTPKAGPEFKQLSIQASEVPADTSSKTEMTGNNDFQLGPGDQIEISVWRNSELNRTIAIDPSGRIRMPLAGEINAQGLTVSQLNQEITKRLSQYISNPYVDVNVQSVTSRKVHVLGEVKSPGTFSYLAKIPVWEAISKAGGFTDDANKKNFLLVRIHSGDAYIYVRSLDFQQIFENGVLKDGYFLENGDVLYVPEVRIANIERFMQRLSNILAPFNTIQRMITVTPNMIDALEGTSTTNVIN